MTEPIQTPMKAKVRWTYFAGLFVLIVLIVGVGFYVYKDGEAEEHREAATKMFAPAFEALEQPIVEAEPQPVDIDKTVRIIHGLDKALEGSGSLQEYLNYMARQDYRGVAPEVLEARKAVMEVLFELYAKQTQLENQEATFTVTRTILSAMTLVDADLSVSSGAAPAFDKEQAKKILDDLRKDQEQREGMLNGLVESETQLMGLMTKYSEAYYNNVQKWDKLVILRDRAYLAAAAGDWQKASEAASVAIEKSPSETEAHILKALALIEMHRSDDLEGSQLVEANQILDDYIQNHPGKTAPALVLKGMALERAGDAKGALLNYQQSAAYFPKQSEALTDMLDPYKVRSYLRKSKEGDLIVDLYESTMLGAGVFSPDLHMAKTHFANGETEEGRKKVLDHFQRRRNQAQWNLVISDIEFCRTYLGPDFDHILEEDSHLSLVVSPTLIGSKLDVSVLNQSSRDLYNGTLLMAIRFTDMHREDWQVFKVAETVPLVKGGLETSFGTMEVNYDFLGQTRGVDDIVMHRAILITDNAVVWVDTDEHKLALARDVNAAVKTSPQAAEKRASWFESMKISPNTLMTLIEKSGEVDVDLSLGKDDVSVNLPRELAVLNPVFRMKSGDQELPPTQNSLGKDGIQLKFGSVENFEAEGASSVVTVVVNSQFGEFEIDVDISKKSIAGVRYQ